MSLFSQFGGKVRPQDKKRFEKSPQWDGNKFNNQSETNMNIGLSTLPGLLKEQFTDTKKRKPVEPLPVQPFDPQKFNSEPDKPKFVWYGHSVLLLQIKGKNLLIDPMLGPDAAPIAPFSSGRFSENTLDLIDKLPHLDAILMTHDHYDHLDLASMKKLKSKASFFMTALGVGRHLESWGIPEDQIREFDWWDELEFEGIKITFTPSRHFSGRGLTDRAKSLWGGWVFESEPFRIYWSGDGGHDEHFKKIGEKFGDFDWAFIECGQYNEHWAQIHMFPEESIQAAQEAGSQLSIPVHWGGFALALHHWKDPIERFTAEAKKQGHPIVTPRLGEIVILGQEPRENDWWESLK